ncbi:VOC family protein [Escherichia coli]
MANWQSIDELQDIASDLPRFTHALDELSRRLGLNITPLTADHISLRCHQNVTAERWRRGFEQCGELLSENMINGRPICLFKNCMNRYRLRTGSFLLWSYRGPG